MNNIVIVLLMLIVLIKIAKFVMMRRCRNKREKEARRIQTEGGETDEVLEFECDKKL